MTEILVWVAIITSWDGGVVMVPNLATQDSCERLVSRAAAVKTPADRRTLSGTCTQVAILVPKAAPAPVINVQPAATPAPTIKNVVVVKKDK